jgi:DNA-binding NtrC family response regulator
MSNNEAVVLVIDDVSAIIEELLTFMELHGIPALGVSDLDQAISALELNSGIKVLACDVRLGRESGLSIVSRLHNHPSLSRRDFRFLFMTGDQIMADVDAITTDCMILTKPVQPQLLMGTVQQMLRDARAVADEKGVQ